MKKEVFDSEIDASMYPLPYFIYKLTKCLLEINPAIYSEVNGLLSNTVSVLVGHALAKVVKDPKSANMQVRYFSLAARLLSTLNKQYSGSNQEWSSALKDSCENALLSQICSQVTDGKITGSKDKE